MDGNMGYRRFKLIFQSFILIFGIGLIFASVAGWGEMDRALLYLILGIVFTAESIFGLYKNFRYKSAR